MLDGRRIRRALGRHHKPMDSDPNRRSRKPDPKDPIPKTQFQKQNRATRRPPVEIAFNSIDTAEASMQSHRLVGDIHKPSQATLAADDFPACLGTHPRAKSDRSLALDAAFSVRIVHASTPPALGPVQDSQRHRPTTGTGKGGEHTQPRPARQARPSRSSRRRLATRPRYPRFTFGRSVPYFGVKSSPPMICESLDLRRYLECRRKVVFPGKAALAKHPSPRPVPTGITTDSSLPRPTSPSGR